MSNGKLYTLFRNNYELELVKGRLRNWGLILQRGRKKGVRAGKSLVQR